MKKRIVVLLTFVLALLFAVPVLAGGVLPAWFQGFEQNTAGWYTDDTPGPVGWCGDITRYELGSGPVDPSVGYSYAVVENGSCNAYWTNLGWVSSGPYSPFGGFSETWPQSGFVTELDIYLDPAWVAGTGFDYYVSMRILSDGSFRYFLFPVEKTGGVLLVSEQEIGAAGWYTFRVRFGEEDGQLEVTFELSRDGRVMFAQPVTTTAFTGESTSSFSVTDVGTGYVWFNAITDGLQLPIDQQMYRPGQ